MCHVIQDISDPVMVRCKECKLAYSLFDCPQCQGTGVIKGFKTGQLYGCLCGFTATFITCNMCTAMLCLPPKKKYENVVIECKKCRHKFKYNTCQTCQECNYLSPEDSSDKLRCFNEYCVNFNKASAKTEQKVNRTPADQPKN